MQITQVDSLRPTENENSKSKFVCICALYNKFMGGIDLLDSLIAFYHTKNKPNTTVSSLHIPLQRPHHRAGMAALQKRV